VRQLQRLRVVTQQIQDQFVTLTAEQQHYLSRVLRLRSGDRFLALLDSGVAWLAKLEDGTAELLEPQSVKSELSLDVTLVISLPKGSGFDDVVRQVTELGVRRIVPVMSDRTVLKPSANRHDRWQRIAGEATEQSERSQTPTVEEPIDFSRYLNDLEPPKSNDLRYFCWGRGDSVHLLSQLQTDLLAGDQIDMTISITIAIGPEGGWTDEEVTRSVKAGFVSVSLGKRILRAITAPAAAMAIVGAVVEAVVEAD
jgi:16S rRNA (uracil1498-N3)-methyltransferase